MRDETERGEPKMRLMRIFLLFFVFTLAGFLSAEDGLPVTRSICLLKSEQGSGSGFFASFEDLDVDTDFGSVDIDGVENLSSYKINCKVDAGAISIDGDICGRKYQSAGTGAGSIKVNVDAGNIDIK